MTLASGVQDAAILAPASQPTDQLTETA